MIVDYDDDVVHGNAMLGLILAVLCCAVFCLGLWDLSIWSSVGDLEKRVDKLESARIQSTKQPVSSMHC